MGKNKSFKRVLIFLAAVAIIISSMVTTSEVHAEDDYRVSKIEITFDEPKEGDDIAAFISNKGNLKIPAGSHYSVSGVRIRVGKWPNEEYLTSGKFGKQDYYIYFDIEFEEFYKNSSDIMHGGIIINGYEATSSVYGSGNILEAVSLSVGIGKPIINKINFIVPEPEIGKSLSRYCTIDADPADAVSGNITIRWYKGDEDLSLEDALKEMGSDGSLTVIGENETCEEGKYYYAYLNDEGSDLKLNDKYQDRIKGGCSLINGEVYKGPGFAVIVKYGPMKYKYMVSFETGSGSKIDSQSVAEGETAVRPDDPIWNGHTFDGWYTSNDYSAVYDFGTPVTKDTVIYAKWTENKDSKNEPKYKNEWVDGKWYDEFGNCVYEGILSWKQNEKGWWVEDTKGWYPQSQWQKIDGKWYYFCADGYMDYSEYRDGCWLGADGAWDERYFGGNWKSDSTGWWYEDASGWYPRSQWVWIDGSCYYFGADGYMLTNQYVDGCWVGADGAWVK